MPTIFCCKTNNECLGHPCRALRSEDVHPTGEPAGTSDALLAPSGNLT